MASSGKIPQAELVPLQSKHEHLLNELEQTETNNVGLVIRFDMLIFIVVLVQSLISSTRSPSLFRCQVRQLLTIAVDVHITDKLTIFLLTQMLQHLYAGQGCRLYPILAMTKGM